MMCSSSTRKPSRDRAEDQIHSPFLEGRFAKKKVFFFRERGSIRGSRANRESIREDRPTKFKANLVKNLTMFAHCCKTFGALL